jgi:general secretion pathway protein C
MLQVKEASRKTFWPALCALIASAFAAYALVSWVLQIQSLQTPASVAPVLLPGVNLSAGDSSNSHVAVALGAPQASQAAQQGAGIAAQAAPQWNLLGVVAGVSGQGSALIGVDGQAPKAFLPGQTVAPGWVLHSVGHRLARLAPSLQEAPTVTLELPK